jgi:membrane protein
MDGRVTGGLGLRELARRTWREVYTHNTLGRAAELAYYFLLAFFPMLIVLLSLISLVPTLKETVLFWVLSLMPPDAKQILRDWLTNVFGSRRGGLLSLGLVFSLWAASTGMTALMGALNEAYDVQEWRPFWKSRLIALGLTIALSILVIGGASAINYGEPVAKWIANRVGLGGVLTMLGSAPYYLMGLAMLTLGMGLIYYIAPNVQLNWIRIAPGTIFAVLSFILVSYLFSVYLTFAPSYDATYGSIGAIVVLMLWFYLLGLVICIGGEINAEIHKVAGERIIEKERRV